MHLIYGLNTGGAETLVKDYVLNFDRKKIDVILLCLSHVEGSPYERLLKKNGIHVVYATDCLPFHGKNLFTKTFNHALRFLIVKRIIRRESPDIIHTHLPVNRFVKFAKPKRKTVIIHTVHSEPIRLWPKNKRGFRSDFVAAKWLVKKYNMRFIVLHDKMKEEINNLFGVSNTTVLNNGIELSRFGGKQKYRDQIRRELGIPFDAFVVGHVGRFSKAKNHEFLLEIFNEIKKQKKNAFLLMIGDGDGKQKIVANLNERHLEDSYIVLSNRSDIPELMSIMDCFVFPSKYEGLGIALIEAQESRLPCFISDKVPTHAIMSNLVTVLPLDDGAKKWSKAILSYRKPKRIVLDDKEWDIRLVTRKLEQIYLDSLAEKKNGKK